MASERARHPIDRDASQAPDGESRAPAALKGLDGEHVTYAVGWA